MTALMSVDLPAPFGPTMPTSCPARHFEIDPVEHRLFVIRDGQIVDLERKRCPLASCAHFKRFDRRVDVVFEHARRKFLRRRSPRHRTFVPGVPIASEKSSPPTLRARSRC